jgi:murein L,D-transpeptidase YcbB/YkuD
VLPSRYGTNFIAENSASEEIVVTGGVAGGRMGRRSGSGWLLPAGALALVIGGSLALTTPCAFATDPADAAPAEAGAPLAPAQPFTGNAELKARLDAPGALVVAGEQLHPELLRRFYAAHDYRTVWDTRPQVATALTNAVLAAGAQGLDPALFHATALAEQSANLPPIDRELLLSDAFLYYADALARGAMPIEARFDDEDLAPEPTDAVAVLDAAISAPDPAKVITSVVPSAPEYQAMLRAYTRTEAAAGRDAAPPRTRAVAEKQLRQLAVNLERLRWLPRAMPADRVMVNTATQTLQLFRDDRPVFATRVVVGQPDWQTPEFETTIDSVLYNPPWNVPPSILAKEILPKLATDPDYLAEHHMRYRGPNRVQQEAGPYSALGRLKFEMDDRFDVYLHDTPQKEYFLRSARMLSHGCVRVQNPTALAALLLDIDAQQISKGIALGYTHRRELQTPMPVFVVYQTALVDADGSIRFLADAYQRDDDIWAHLTRARRLPMAQESVSSQRKG